MITNNKKMCIKALFLWCKRPGRAFFGCREVQNRTFEIRIVGVVNLIRSFAGCDDSQNSNLDTPLLIW